MVFITYHVILLKFMYTIFIGFIWWGTPDKVKDDPHLKISDPCLW